MAVDIVFSLKNKVEACEFDQADFIISPDAKSESPVNNSQF